MATDVHPAVEPSQFEPLLPTKGVSALASDAAEVVKRSLALTGAAHPTTLATLRTLLRAMNSYYSNRIEGQHTHPLDIERALRPEFSASPAVARLQRLAVAHIDAEAQLEQLGATEVLTMGFLRTAHQALYHYFADDLIGPDGVVVPSGRYRSTEVVVGRHVAPAATSIERFARRFDTVYSKTPSLDMHLVVVGAAHHRATWVHPFIDGNGRAIRLQTHCALLSLSGGLWSVSRGMARQRDSYYRHLEDADSARAGDLDGRGTLSEAALHRWCEWFIALCADQVDFMATMLRLDSVSDRIRSLIAARGAIDSRYRTEVALPLIYAFTNGPCARGDFLRMTGLGERTARSALSHLLDVGLLTSRDHRSPVQIAFPLDCLQYLFPDLYPEASTSPPTLPHSN
jgi:Fic family protein